METTLTHKYAASSHLRTVEEPQVEFKIFVVEDSDIYRKLLIRYISILPNMDQSHKPICKIFGFSSGGECLDNMHEKPDIIVLDYYLDEEQDLEQISGLALLRKLLDKSPDTKIITLSEQDEVIVAAEILHAGAFEYITKVPDGRSRVINSISRALKSIKDDRKNRRRKRIVALTIFLIGLFLGILV